MSDTEKRRVVLFLVVLAAALLRFAAGYVPFERLWGVRTLDTFPLQLQVLWTLLPVLLAVPAMQKRLESMLQARIRGTLGGSRLSALLFLLVAVLALLFPMDTFFYGDGGLLVPQIHRLAAGDPVQLDIVLNYKSSPLAGLLLYGIAALWPLVLDAAGATLPSHALYPFPLLGAVMALLLALSFLRMKEHGFVPLTRALLLLGGAGALLFFGYAEFYLPVFVFVGLFLVTAEIRLRRGGPVFPVCVTFAAAVAAHYYSVLLLPALIYVLLPEDKRRSAPWAGRAFFAVLAALATSILVIGIIAGASDAASRVFIPLAPLETPAGTIYYTIFSRYHLIDILNIIFLLAPFTIPVFAAAFSLWRPGMMSQRLRFHLLATLPFLAFLCVAHATLGFARDWDFATPLGPLLAFLTAAVLETDPRQVSPAAERPALGASFGVLMLLWSLPWILLHLDSDATAARFERLMALDEGHMQRDNAVSGYEALRKYHQNRGNTAKDLALSRKKIELLDYPVHYQVHIAKISRLHAVDARGADVERRWVLMQLHRAAADLRSRNLQRGYAISLAQIDSVAEALAFQAYTERAYPQLDKTLAELAALTGGTHPPLAVQALRLYEQKRYDEAVEAFQRLLNRGFLDPRIFVWQGTALALQGRYTEALAVFESGITHFPDDTALAYTLARAYLSSRTQPERARDLLLQCLEVGVAPDRDREIRLLLTQ